MEEKIYFINGISNDPCFNLASEEFLLKRRGERFIYVWQNAPSVIVGVNQNTAEEVNFAYTDANGIKVVRRQTGGGAVYHDLNNVCYTIIDSFSADRDNYRYFTEGVIGYLATLGVTAEFSGRNDISVCGKKISGNAQCVYKNRIMHHGTILFNTDKEVLENALKPHKFKIESKGVKSNRARVTNVLEHLPSPMSVGEFVQGLSQYLKSGAEEFFFTSDMIEEINGLVKSKYSTFEWNVGSSPKAEIVAEKRFDFGTVKASFNVSGGRLCDVSITGDFFSIDEISGLNRMLNGILYSKQHVEEVIASVGRFIVGATPKEISELFFA